VNFYSLIDFGNQAELIFQRGSMN